MTPLDNIDPWLAALIIAGLWLAVVYKFIIKPWRQNNKKDPK